MPAVHANDVFFALHAFIVTFLTLIQCAVYDRGGQRISWPAALGAGGAAAAILAYLGAVVGAAAQGGHGIATVGVAAAPSEPDLPCGDILSWLSFLYFLSYIKLAVSLVKYIPQVLLSRTSANAVALVSPRGWFASFAALAACSHCCSWASEACAMPLLALHRLTPLRCGPLLFGRCG